MTLHRDQLTKFGLWNYQAYLFEFKLVEELRESMLVNTKRSIGMFELWRRGGFDLRGTIVGCVIAIAVGFSGIAGLA